jgi:hypothetical protein
VPTEAINKKIAARLDEFTQKAAALMRGQTGAVS